MTLHGFLHSGGLEIYNFGSPFLGHHYFILSLSDLCLGEGKKIFKGHMASPCTRTAAPGVMKFTILVVPSLVIISIYIVRLIDALEKRGRFL